jgi:hypothetical protein
VEEFTYGDGDGFIELEFLGNIADFSGVNMDVAFRRLNCADDAFQDRGFPCPVESENHDYVFRLDGKRNILKYGFISVREGGVGEFDESMGGFFGHEIDVVRGAYTKEGGLFKITFYTPQICA